jgi:hypothetical protein
MELHIACCLHTKAGLRTELICCALWPQFYFNDDTPGRYYHQEFPDVYCWSMPHMIHVAVSTIGLLLFTLMAGMFTLAEMGGWSRACGKAYPVILADQEHKQDHRVYTYLCHWSAPLAVAELNPLSHNYLAMAHSK